MAAELFDGRDFFCVGLLLLLIDWFVLFVFLTNVEFLSPFSL